MTFWPNVSLYSLFTFVVTGALYLVCQAITPGPTPSWEMTDPLIKWWFGGLLIVFGLSFAKANYDYEKFWEDR